MQKAPLFGFFPFKDFVLFLKNEIFSATLSTSSIAVTVSVLKLLAGHPSTAAAMAVRAEVALTPMVEWLIRGTLPISKLKTTVDFSASCTISRNFCSAVCFSGGEIDANVNIFRSRGSAA